MNIIIEQYKKNKKENEKIMKFKRMLIALIVLAIAAGAAACVDKTPSSVAPESVSLNKTPATLEVNQTSQLTATVLPANATDKTVTFSSDKPETASVSAAGLITAKAVGEAVITAATVNGKTATCAVTVVPEVILPSSVSLNEDELTLDINQTFELTATVLPANATDKTVTFLSDKPGTASVSSGGLVKGIAAGNATITATTVNGKTAKCEVTVNERIALITGITVTAPTKTLYKVSEPIVLTGGSIAVAYDDESVSNISLAAAGVTVDGFTSAAVGAGIVVTVSYQTFHDTFTVNVYDVTFTPPAKTTYYKGAAALNTAGGKVVIIKPDTSAINVPLDDLDMDVVTFDTSIIGPNKNVVLKYTASSTAAGAYIYNQQFTFQITVADSSYNAGSMKDAAFIADMTVGTGNLLTANVTSGGLQLKNTNEWGNIILKTSTALTDVYGIKVKVSGVNNQVFNFKFNNGLGVSAACQYLSNYKNNDIPLHNSGDTSTGAIGGTFESIIPFYRVGFEEQPNWNNIEGPMGWQANVMPVVNKLNSGQTVEMTFGYAGDTAAFTVEEFYFVDKAAYESEYNTEASWQLTPPSQTSYSQGESLDLTGGKILKYNKFGFLIGEIALSDSGVQIAGFDSSVAAASQTVSVTYNTVTKTFTVEIQAVPDVVVLTAPTKTQYYRGAVAGSLSLADGYLTVTKFGQAPFDVQLTDPSVTVKTFNTSTVGASQVVLTYQGKDYNYSITVADSDLNTARLLNEDYIAQMGGISVMGENGTYDVTGGKFAVSFSGIEWTELFLAVHVNPQAAGMEILVSGAPDDYFILNIYYGSGLTKRLQYNAAWGGRCGKIGAAGLQYIFINFSDPNFSVSGGAAYAEFMLAVQNGEKIGIGFVLEVYAETKSCAYEKLEFLSQTQLNTMESGATALTTPPTNTSIFKGADWAKINLAGASLTENSNVVNLPAAGATLRFFDTGSVGQKTVYLLYKNVLYYFEITVLDTALDANTMKNPTIFNALYVANGNGQTSEATAGGVVLTNTDTWGNTTFKASTNLTDVYAIKIKITGAAGYNFNVLFYAGVGYDSFWALSNGDVYGVEGNENLHGGSSTGGTFEGYLVLYRVGHENEANWGDGAGPFGWQANVMPVVNTLNDGGILNVTVGYSGGTAPMTLEEFYFVTQAEFLSGIGG